jgi:hypothetical protein
MVNVATPTHAPLKSQGASSNPSLHHFLHTVPMACGFSERKFSSWASHILSELQSLDILMLTKFRVSLPTINTILNLHWLGCFPPSTMAVL